jgi:hypothetical protein
VPFYHFTIFPYRLMHPEANLTEQQKQILMDAIRRTANNPVNTVVAVSSP